MWACILLNDLLPVTAKKRREIREYNNLHFFYPIVAYELVACRILKGTNVVTMLSRHSIYFIDYLECTFLNL